MWVATSKHWIENSHKIPPLQAFFRLMLNTTTILNQPGRKCARKKQISFVSLSLVHTRISDLITTALVWFQNSETTNFLMICFFLLFLLFDKREESGNIESEKNRFLETLLEQILRPRWLEGKYSTYQKKWFYYRHVHLTNTLCFVGFLYISDGSFEILVDFSKYFVSN